MIPASLEENSGNLEFIISKNTLNIQGDFQTNKLRKIIISRPKSSGILKGILLAAGI